MITEIFDDTERDWSGVLACLKILVRDGHPVKISKDDHGFLLLQYTYGNDELIWFEERK